MIAAPNQHWDTYGHWIQQCVPTHYASQKLWLADDLAASISPRPDAEYEPDDGEIVLSVGVIDTHCAFSSFVLGVILVYPQVLGVSGRQWSKCSITLVWPLSLEPMQQVD